MSAEIIDTTHGVITVRISGRLTQPELASLQKVAGEAIEKLGRVRFLVLVEEFEGLKGGGDWGDISFSMRYDEQIEKMAIVCEKKWEGQVLVFASKGVRKFPIEHFEPPDLAKARVWLATKTSQD